MHPRMSRRTMVQAGSVGLLGLGMNHVAALRAMAANASARPAAKSVIYIFLSGGLAQQDSFDPKPEAPDAVRGEFSAIATKTAGVRVCEHLPKLAARSERWSLVRSLTHPYNEHSQGHMVMLSGRTPLPPGFDPNKPKSTDWPSMAAIAADVLRSKTNLPPAVVLPDKIVHNTGRVIPGQFAGLMGSSRDPWFISASPYHPKTYGAYPEFEFHHARGRETTASLKFEAPNLSLPAGLSVEALENRSRLRTLLESQRAGLDAAASVAQFDAFRQSAISLLMDPATRRAFDVTQADAATLDRYGRHSFGWSLLMARQLVEAGVSLVQVNLGNNETWDTHEAAFPNLKNFLLPPLDQSLSALLDDLHDRHLLDDTLIVMAGEFGRTPRIFSIPGAKLPGRDHWGAAQTVFVAGGGTRGGVVVGASDRSGGYPAADPQTPENLAATIYHALGLPEKAVWRDVADRPHHLYYGDPIAGLLG
jgi:hypothetical protein